MSPKERPRLVSGVKPTGRLHLGNLEGALRSWVLLEEQCELYCMIANWHALTTGAPRPRETQVFTRDILLDCLAVGLDPTKTIIFLQSDVKEHAELHLLLSMITPLSWLERIPTYQAIAKEQAPSYGLLGYPVLQAADILAYRALGSPVGRDQLPHLEAARAIARRFNHRYGRVFPEPIALFSEAPVLLGLDGRKMSKSYDNVIYIADSPEDTESKILGAFTTPTKIHKTDPGIPESCPVCQLRKVYDPDGYLVSWDEDRSGKRGCLENKRELARVINEALAPIRARRKALEKEPSRLDEILRAGAARARAVARETLGLVREAMGLEQLS